MGSGWVKVAVYCALNVCVGCGSTSDAGRGYQQGAGGAVARHDAGENGAGGALVESGGSPEKNDAGSREPVLPRCVTGDQQSCACLGGMVGIHVCDAEGRWQPCTGCRANMDSGADSSTECAAPLTRCGTACVDLDADPRNCGFCAHDCRGATCTIGLCALTVLATGQARPTSLAIDDKYLYWTNGGDFPQGDTASGSVVRLPREGGDVETLATEQYAPSGIAVNADHVFWLVGGPGGTFDGSLMTAPLAGGKPASIAAEGMAYSGAVVAEMDAVYWVNAGGQVRRFTFATSTSTTLSANGRAEGTALVLRNGRVYWFGGDGNDQGLQFAFIAGGLPTTIVSADDVYAIAVDSRFAYYTRYREGTVNRVSPLGDNRKTLAEGQAEPLTLAVDDRRVYWTTLGGAVRSTDVDGSGNVVTLAVGQGNPSALVMDAQYLYFIDTDLGTVVRVAK